MKRSWEPEPAPVSRAGRRGRLAERVSDAERDHTVSLLREHLVVGRLTLDEFSERISIALEARTRRDLVAAMRDLPRLAVPAEEASRRPARRRFVSVMSGTEAKGRWRIAERATAVAVMGGVDIDLRRAEIDGPEVVLTAVAFWGGISIVVPEGFDVELQGFSFMGGRHLRLRDVRRLPGSPRIRVRGFAIMGGIDVRSKPTRTGRELGQSIIDHVLGTVNAIADMPSLAGVGASGATAIDVEALGRDIKKQFRAQRRASRQHHDERDQRRGSRRQLEESMDDTSADAASAWRGMPEPSGPRLPSPVSEGTVTILFSDMVNYASMTERLGDRASREVLVEHHRIVRGLLGAHAGREIKVQGDGFMVAFGGVARALRCAAALQRAFRDHSASHPERPIAVHIGVHTGEAIEEDDDFLGHTVIVASRLAEVAAPGEILVSSLSAQMVERTEEFTFLRPQEIALKGLTRAQKVVSLKWTG